MVRGCIGLPGITVEEMPNFAMLYSPTPTSRTLISSSKTHSLYVSRIVAALLDAKRSGKNLRLELKNDTVKAFNQDIQAKLARST